MAHFRSGGRGLMLIDQAVSGAGNAVPLLIASTRLGAVELATLSLAMLLVTSAIGFQRALLLEPTLSIIGGGKRNWHSPAIGLIVSISFSAAAGVATALLLTQSPDQIAAVFLVSSIICFHDFLRYRAIHHGRLGQTLISDTSWLLVAVTAVAVLPATWTILLIGWAAGAALGLIALYFRSNAPRHEGLLSEAWARGRFQLAETGVVTALTVVPFFVASALGWDARVAALRLVQSALGPLNTLHSAVSLAVLTRSKDLQGFSAPEVSRVHARIQRPLVAISVLYTALVGGAFLLIPIDSRAVSDQIPLAVAVAGCALILTSLASPTITLARMFGHQDWVLWTRLLVVGGAGVLATIGVLAFPTAVDPASSMLLLSAVLGVPLWQFVRVRLLRSRPRP